MIYSFTICIPTLRCCPASKRLKSILHRFKFRAHPAPRDDDMGRAGREGRTDSAESPSGPRYCLIWAWGGAGDGPSPASRPVLSFTFTCWSFPSKTTRGEYWARTFYRYVYQSPGMQIRSLYIRFKAVAELFTCINLLRLFFMLAVKNDSPRSYIFQL